MKFLIIDGNSILNRSFYGIRELRSSKGVPTNAIYGFFNILHKHITEENPDKIAVAFDLKEKTHRHLLYENYKGTRSATPEDLLSQFPLTKDILRAMGISVLEKAGIEADDIIGIVSRYCEEHGDSCMIVTGDRDALQLVSDKTTVKLATTKQDIIYTPGAIEEKYGLTPDRMTDLKALMGDSSDNIPGVKGIGEKTALSLLEKYGSLDGVYEHTEEIKGCLKEKIINGRDDAYLSLKLGTILREGDVGTDIGEIAPPVPDAKKLSEIFSELELKSLADKFISKENDSFEEENKIEETEYYGEIPSGFFENKSVFSLTEHENGFLVSDLEKVILLPLDKLSFLNKKTIITHNSKKLYTEAIKQNIELSVIFDCMLAAYVLNPSETNYGLNRLFSEFLNISGNDAFYCLNLKKLADKEEASLKENGGFKVFTEIEMPLSLVLADMEVSGFKADPEFIETFGRTLDLEIKDAEQEIFRLAGHEFNINSTKQLGTVLFEELILPCRKKTKTGYSTDNEVLESLSRYHPIIENVIIYRKLSKLKSTYVDGLLKTIAEDGRIHSKFTQTVTQTGRISSVEPNLQNIPVRTELGRQLRHAFIAKEGSLLIDADYSQIELRILAHISDDKVMKEAFINNTDIHRVTASEIFDLPEEMITGDMRSIAKTVNFGIVYGIGEFSLSKDLKIPRKEAKRYIDSYLNTYSGVNRYMEDVVKKAEESGYVETLFGRRRYVDELKSRNKQIQAFGHRVCRNTPIQGTAADLIKIAMIRVYNALKEKLPEAKLILQVHDELIVEAPENKADAAAKILKEEMEKAAVLSVPLVADTGIGKDWFDAH